MTHISLLEFIRTGRFGPLTVGKSTRDDVHNLFGTDFSHADCGYMQIIAYGWYEFFYETESLLLTAIQNDHLPYDCKNHDEMVLFENERVKIQTDFIQPWQDMTFSQICTLLDQENIPFKVVSLKHSDQNQIHLANGIRFDFLAEKTIGWESKKVESEKIEDPMHNVLNGIRLFQY